MHDRYLDNSVNSRCSPNVGDDNGRRRLGVDVEAVRPAVWLSQR